jgi:hypothetical protein
MNRRPNGGRVRETGSKLDDVADVFGWQVAGDR